jgi:glycerophosphoryl diester phosphodiesterase
MSPSPTFDLQGHRGARGLWPENSLHGFAAAVALGVTSIELDVVLTADGVPVVYHDLTLNPDLTRGPDGKWLTAPTPAVATLTAAALAQYDVGRIRPRGRYAARCRGQTPMDGIQIPTLDEVCRLVAGTPVRVDIEIKTDRRNPASEAGLPGIVDAVLQVIDATAVEAQSAIRSFDWRVLRLIRQRRPALNLAWLSGLATDAKAGAVIAAIQQDGWPDWTPVWAPDHRLLRRRHIARVRQAGVHVKPWTVNAAFRMRQLIRWGVDGFCTDRPDLARIVLGGVAVPGEAQAG